MTTSRLKRLVPQWPGLLVAVLVWCLLWGGFGVTDVLGGLLAAVIAHLVFPMPVSSRELTVRPLSLAWLILRFLGDVVVSTVQVGWYALRPAGQPRSSVVAVPTATRSDLFMTMMAGLLTLVPGSVVVEAQRSTGILFLHCFGVATEEEVAAAKANARKQELRLLRAFAHRDVVSEAERAVREAEEAARHAAARSGRVASGSHEAGREAGKESR